MVCSAVAEPQASSPDTTGVTVQVARLRAQIWDLQTQLAQAKDREWRQSKALRSDLADAEEAAFRSDRAVQDMAARLTKEKARSAALTVEVGRQNDMLVGLCEKNAELEQIIASLNASLAAAQGEAQEASCTARTAAAGTLWMWRHFLPCLARCSSRWPVIGWL